MPTLRALLLAVMLGSCAAAENKHCDGKFLARWLGYNPDAWKIINHVYARYHLMFYSSGRLQDSYKCLSTTKSSPNHGRKWERIVTYHTSPNSTVYSGLSHVSTQKSDEFFVYDDSLKASYFKQSSPLNPERLFSKNEVIFMEEKKCIVLKSDLFGYEVWVDTEYLKRTGKIPYFCTFFLRSLCGS